MADLRETVHELKLAAPALAAVSAADRNRALAAMAQGLSDNKDRIYAANDFINWFCSDDMQLLWCMETGYLPISSSVLYSDQYQEYVKNVNPGIQRVIEEMFNKSTGTDPHFGSLSEWRAAAQSVLTQLDEDAGYTPAQAVEDLKAQINDAIELYNLSNY